MRATKRFSIEKAPNVLTLQLKRFEYGGFGAKINKQACSCCLCGPPSAPAYSGFQVDFTPVLDLRPFMSFPCVKESYAYRLTGVLVHSGRSTHSGHYFSFVRSPAGAWFLMDDETVRSVSEKMVLQQRAYMLFYTRTVAAHTAGTPAPVAVPKLARAAALAAAPAAAAAGKSQSRMWMDAALPEAKAEPLPRAARLAGHAGVRAEAVDAARAAAESVRQEVRERRMSEEGVNLDEELVKMTTYQQAYAAASRMITAARDLYDIVLNMV